MTRGKASAIPWSIKGVSQQARDIARMRAQSAGMTMGEWLSHKILINAQGVKPMPSEVILQKTGRIEELSSRLDQLLEPK